jgi:general secretion pathway protein A
MYLQYFGLRENPFALPPDPRYLYLSLRHQEALAHLSYAITAGGGFAVLTGEVGTGKTMMVRAMLERLPGNVDVALILYPMLSVHEFVAAICDELGVGYPKDTGSLKTLIDALNRFLLDNHAKGRRTVLIIDEAHQLSHEVLEQVRLLTNLETTKDKLLQILLIGQPELAAVLAQPQLRQLAQRVTARYDLKSLLPKESGEYVNHRLRVAGARRPLFSAAAIKWIHRLSRGVPRMINVVCDRALLGAYAHGRQQASAATVRRATRELHLERAGSNWRPARVALATAALVLVLVAIVWWAASGPMPRIATGEPAIAKPVASEPPAVAEPGEPPAVPLADTPRPRELAALLADPAAVSDGETVFSSLFALWRVDYGALAGKTACERAQNADLRCLYASGTWNSLRQYNRPAVIELYDAAGERRHVLVSELKDTEVALELGASRQWFALTEVDRHWLGKYLLLWKEPEVARTNLRRGMRGESVNWLRKALARYNDQPVPAGAGDLFDAELEQQVQEFQRRHRIPADGIAGRLTLMQLANYDAALAPPRLWSAGQAAR